MSAEHLPSAPKSLPTDKLVAAGPARKLPESPVSSVDDEADSNPLARRQALKGEIAALIENGEEGIDNKLFALLGQLDAINRQVGIEPEIPSRSAPLPSAERHDIERSADEAEGGEEDLRKRSKLKPSYKFALAVQKLTRFSKERPGIVRGVLAVGAFAAAAYLLKQGMDPDSVQQAVSAEPATPPIVPGQRTAEAVQGATQQFTSPEISDAAWKISSGEGMEKTLDQLHIPKDKWLDVLNDEHVRKVLLENGDGYIENGELRLNLTESGRFQDTSMDAILQAGGIDMAPELSPQIPAEAIPTPPHAGVQPFDSTTITAPAEGLPALPVGVAVTAATGAAAGVGGVIAKNRRNRRQTDEYIPEVPVPEEKPAAEKPSRKSEPRGAGPETSDGTPETPVFSIPGVDPDYQEPGWERQIELTPMEWDRGFTRMLEELNKLKGLEPTDAYRQLNSTIYDALAELGHDKAAAIIHKAMDDREMPHETNDPATAREAMAGLRNWLESQVDWW